jgi:hypothetical protein
MGLPCCLCACMSTPPPTSKCLFEGAILKEADQYNTVECYSPGQSYSSQACFSGCAVLRMGQYEMKPESLFNDSRLGNGILSLHM